MPWADTAYQDAALDSLWGENRGPTTCATFELGLLTGDPRFDGVEVAGTGYARIVCTNDATFWQPSTNGSKVSTVQTFPAPTGLWDSATHDGIWALVDGVMTLIDFAPLGTPIDVDAGDPAPRIQITRRFNAALL